MFLTCGSVAVMSLFYGVRFSWCAFMLLRQVDLLKLLQCGCVLCLFLMATRVGLQFVIVAYLGHTHLLFEPQHTYVDED